MKEFYAAIRFCAISLGLVVLLFTLTGAGRLAYAKHAVLFLGYSQGSKMYAYVSEFHLPDSWSFNGSTEGFAPNLVYTSNLYASTNCKGPALVHSTWFAPGNEPSPRRNLNIAFDSPYTTHVAHVGSVDLKALGLHICGAFK